MTIQAQILDLLAELKEAEGLSLLFISHDLGIVRRIADRVCVMKDGEIVQTGTPEEIVTRARDQKAHVVGLSILSGSHLPLVEEVMTRMREAGLSDTPVIVGGIIPDEDARRLLAMGVAKVYTPKDFQLNAIMMDVVSLADPKPVAAE